MEKKSKIYKVSQIVHDLLSSTSAHGLPRLLKAKNRLIKLLWSCVLISSSVIGSYFILTNILDFLKFESTTQISLIEEYVSEFPTVSFCSSNRFSRPLNEMIITLRFNNKYETNYSRFFEQFNDSVYSTCYRFNSGKNMNDEAVPILNAIQHGSTYGLKLELNLNLSDTVDYTELIVIVHNRSFPPFYFNDADYFFSTGSWNYFEIDRIFYQNLEAPYSDCIKDVNKFKLNKTIIDYMKNNKIYSQKECFRFCLFLNAIEYSRCNCTASLDTFQSDCEFQWFDANRENETKKCIENYFAEFHEQHGYQKCLNYCPLECNKLSYTTNVYTENIPVYNGNIKNNTTTDPGIKNFTTYEEVNKNYISLIVFYSDLKYTLISQHPKTELFAFIACIGGIFGLFFGISFLSFFEIFEIMFEALLVFLARDTNLK